MLMNIKCSAVTSIRVNLTYDNGAVKEAVIGVGDLIDVVYNANGIRKHACGKVLVVSATGNDPKGWYIIVDSSDDFDSSKARFSPMNILELEVIAKGDNIETVCTVKGDMAVPYLRIVKGRLQWSKDGCTWYPIRVGRDEILDQEGTMPVPRHEAINTDMSNPDNGIEDAVW